MQSCSGRFACKIRHYPMRPSTITVKGARVYLRAPRRSDEAPFIAAARASRELHGAWAKAPATRAEYAAYLKRFSGAISTHTGFLLMRNGDDALCGIFNFSEIVR